MGRYFRTTAATPLDYMYKLNVPLMQSVIAQNDNYISQSLDQADKLGQLTNYNYINTPEETADAQAIQQDYTKQVDYITDAIRQDPANWRNQASNIRGLRQRLQADYTTGAISKQVANYNKRKESFDTIDKQVELYNTSGGEKGIDANSAAAYKANWDSKFTKTGYDPSNPSKYSTYKGGTAMNNIDIKKALGEGLDKIKADKSKRYTQMPDGSEWYFNKETESMEQITPEKVLQVAMGNVNPMLMQYLRERTDIGLIKGAFDDSGNFITPYSFESVDSTTDERTMFNTLQQQIDKEKNPANKQVLQAQLDSYKNQVAGKKQFQWNNDSYLTPTLQGLVNQYSYSNTEQGREMSNNNVGPTRFTQAQQNFRQGRELTQAKQLAKDKEDGVNQRFKDKLDWDKWKFMNPQAKPGTIGAVKPVVKPTAAPAETTTSNIATNSFEDWTIRDPATNKDVPIISNAGLSTSINQLRDNETSLKAQLKEANSILTNPNSTIQQINSAKTEKIGLEKQLTDVSSSLGMRRDWYNQIVNQALDNNPSSGLTIKDSERDLYNKYRDDLTGAKQLERIKQLRKQFPDVDGPVVSVGTGAPGQVTKVPAPQVQAAVEEYNSFLAVKRRVDQARDNISSELRKSYISSDAIVPNQKESDDVSNIVLNNTQGLQLFDGYGRPASETPISIAARDSKAFGFLGSDKYNMSFTGENNLTEYLHRFGGKMNVEQIGTTTNLGRGGAVLKVTFEDPNGKLPTNPYYIVASPELQRDLATKFSGHKNPAVSKIGQNIGDNEANNIRNQLATPASSAIGIKAPPKVIQVTDTQGNVAPLKVIELSNGTLNITGEDMNGKPMPFRRVDGKGMPGIFTNAEDFIQQLKAYKALTPDQQKALYTD